MARYGQAFKDRLVARLLPPESAAVEVVSREAGISAETLERWCSDALAKGQKSGGWTAAARFEAIVATAAMSEEEKESLRARVAGLGADGRYELYKVSARFEGPTGREQHGFPPVEEVAI